MGFIFKIFFCIGRKLCEGNLEGTRRFLGEWSTAMQVWLATRKRNKYWVGSALDCGAILSDLARSKASNRPEITLQKSPSLPRMGLTQYSFCIQSLVGIHLCRGWDFNGRQTALCADTSTPLSGSSEKLYGFQKPLFQRKKVRGYKWSEVQLPLLEFTLGHNWYTSCPFSTLDSEFSSSLAITSPEVWVTWWCDPNHHLKESEPNKPFSCLGFWMYLR